MKYFLLVLILLITTAVCLWPDLHPEKLIFKQYHWQVDVFIHAGYYFIVCTAILFLKFKKKAIFTAISLFGFSVVLELLQHFSYHRGVDPMDMGSNLLGIGLALGLFTLYASKQAGR